MTPSEAAELGAIAGMRAVQKILHSEGIHGIHVAVAQRRDWRHLARESQAANTDNVPESLRETYYNAFSSAALDLARDIAALD